MATRVLVVLDNLTDETLLAIDKLLLQNDRIVILPIGIPSISVKNKLSHTLISFLEFTKERLDQMKAEVVKFTVSLPWIIQAHKDLKEEYGEDYWLMPHTEKSLWVSKFCHKLFVRLQVEEGKAQVFDKVIYLTETHLNDAPTFNNFLFLKSLASEIIKFFYRFFLIAIFCPLKKIPHPKKGNLLITLYPEWFQFKKNNLTNDMFFSDMVNPLDINSNWSVVLISFPIKTLFSFLKKDRAALSSPRVFFVENYFCFKDIFKILNPVFIKKNLKILGKIKHWNNEFKLGSLDVTDLVQEDLLRSFYNGSFFGNILWKEAFTRLPVQNYNRCFYRMEFQPFENTFLLPLKDKIPFTGFQHSVFGPHFLNYIFPENVFKCDYPDKLPLPSMIVATGNEVKHQLMKAGINSDLFQMVGAVRFNRLFNYNREKRENYRSELGLSLDDFMVFMPVSQILSENLSLIEELSLALVDSKQRFHFYLKINPNKKNDKNFLSSIEKAFEKIAEKHAVHIFSEDPRYYEFIIAADCLCVSGGSASLEALLLGTPTILFEVSNILNHNPGVMYPKTFLVVESAADIKNALETLRAKTFHQDGIEKKKLLEDMFANITSEGRPIFEKIISGEFQ